ncbi:MAG TPA: NUDIX domain-containing protein [Anaeromyxobacteraceae bacterium]|nr:NUDIX domain-containing protein [Anaeromyxobacteraceae bacterium]
MTRKKKPIREVSAGGIVFRRFPEGFRFLLVKDCYKNWGFPKGHLEDGETPAEAALRETREEAGLDQLEMTGPIRIIDWHFRFRGKAIHKFCHFFLMESKEGDPRPQLDEGITDYVWLSIDDALAKLSYDNARGALRRAGEMTRTLVAVGRGRPHPKEPRHPPEPIAVPPAPSDPTLP